MESEKLMPCPFCGGEPKMHVCEPSEANNANVYIRCMVCGAIGGQTMVLSTHCAQDVATQRWNRRSADDHK